MGAHSSLPWSSFTNLQSRSTSFLSEGGLHLSNMCNKMDGNDFLVLVFFLIIFKFLFGGGGPLHSVCVELWGIWWQFDGCVSWVLNFDWGYLRISSSWNDCLWIAPRTHAVMEMRGVTVMRGLTFHHAVFSVLNEGYDRGEPAVSYIWTGWVQMTGWSSRLQENYLSFERNL